MVFWCISSESFDFSGMVHHLETFVEILLMVHKSGGGNAAVEIGTVVYSLSHYLQGFIHPNGGLT